MHPIFVLFGMVHVGQYGGVCHKPICCIEPYLYIPTYNAPSDPSRVARKNLRGFAPKSGARSPSASVSQPSPRSHQRHTYAPHACRTVVPSEQLRVASGSPKLHLGEPVKAVEMRHGRHKALQHFRYSCPSIVQKLHALQQGRAYPGSLPSRQRRLWCKSHSNGANLILEQLFETVRIALEQTLKRASVRNYDMVRNAPTLQDVASAWLRPQACMGLLCIPTCDSWVVAGNHINLNYKDVKLRHLRSRAKCRRMSWEIQKFKRYLTTPACSCPSSNRLCASLRI